MKFQSRAGVMVLSLLLASCFLFVCYSAIAYAGPCGRPESEGPDVPTKAEQALFTKGQTLYTQGLYSEAIVIFSEFLKSYPNSVIKDLNLLWLGRSYLRADDIASAERMGLRLREIADTPFAGMYEEELRIARQGYVKSASPAFIRRNDVAPGVATSQVILVDPGPVILADKPKSSAPPSTSAKSQNASLSSNPAELQIPPLSSTPAKSTISTTSPAPVAVITNQSRDRDRTSPAPSAKIRPPHATPNNVPSRPQKETTASAATKAANVVAPLLRIRIEEMPRVAAANGVVFYRLVLVNEGNGAARDLILWEELNSSLDFASSDPAPSRQEIVARTLVLIFRLTSLEPGASRSILIAVRPRPDAKAKTSTVNTAQTKHSVTYRDGKGNTYHIP